MTPVILRRVRQKWTTGVGDFQAASATADPGGQFWTGGPGLGEKKIFTSPESVESIAETEDGKWRVLAYGGELLWMHRNNLRPITGTRDPATGFGAPAAGDTAALERKLAGAKTAISGAAQAIAAAQRSVS